LDLVFQHSAIFRKILDQELPAYDAEFRSAEKQARKEKLNIWGDSELTKKYLRLKSKWGQHDK
jgi:endonuclease YncB( thermonuclease family)